MRYLIDTASPEKAKKVLEYFPCDGVTTNPTIITREKCDLKRMLSDMREAIGDKMLHVQTMQTEAENMCREAQAIKSLVGEPFYIKLPASKEGLKALDLLKRENIRVTITAVFSPAQALLAARAGADFVAPYVNKLDDVGDGEECVNKIVTLFKQFGLNTKVLSASFRNVEQVTRVALYGSDYITLPPEFYDKLIWHPMTDLALEGFKTDWANVYGDKKPIELVK